MILQSIEYSQHDGTPQEWKLEGCTLGEINLIVGENASGKTKTLNVIGNLGDVLSGDRPLFRTANYRTRFDKDSQRIDYILKCEHATVIEEKLDVDAENLLTREADGVGQIYHATLHDSLKFQSPSNQVASVGRRDAIQHPFLNDLYNWGKSSRHYLFGKDMGQQHLIVSVKAREGAEQRLNPKSTEMVVPMFIEGQKRFSTEFTDSVMEDMGAIGYGLRKVGTAPPISIAVQGMPGEVVGLYVQESDLGGITDQGEMSQGMFRALSLFVQIEYSQLANTPSCILIDDIGEGLDYDRSTALVKRLIKKAKETPIQLIMATNDRFVMNNVPLEYWSVAQRISGVTRMRSYANCPEVFKEFELTGLNNFDFFSSRYYLKDSTQN